ncbi:MAG TPA: polysaccharide lyase family protein [Candidatus Hydrogenedentes bacterium]|nr:polysaccharide lyase family protein [Candidatus Hydrogenedentota bacterium]
MILKRAGLLYLLCIMAASGSAYAEELWRIGALNNDYGEFALAGNYEGFLSSFPQGVQYDVGTSIPDRDWPYVHPGPDDAWAGGKAHIFVIKFDLQAVPVTACRLLLAFVSTHGGGAPAISVSVNGHALDAVQLPNGGNDDVLRNPGAGQPHRQAFLFPSAWLTSGTNQIEVATVSGSWLLYDALKLEDGVPETPDVEKIEAVSTPLFKAVDGSLRQAVRVRVENNGLSGPGLLTLEGGERVEQQIEVRQGTASVMLPVPPFTAAERRKVTLRAGGKSVETEFDAKPERQWTLYVAASAHTDIGYTDLQEKCMALHVDNTIAGLDAASASPDFKWNLEVFAHYDWFKELKPERLADLDRQLQAGRVGLTGLYLNMLTGLCSGAEMMRVLAPAQRRGRELGVNVTMASLNDVPTSIGTLPMFLRHAGVRYFAEAINEDRGPVFMHCDPEMIQSPFWWEAPDGSRVMAIFTRTYFQVWQIKLHESVAAVENTLPGFLDRVVREDYPGDAIFINGAFLDNCAMTPNYAKVAAEWNQTWDYPKFVLATADEYFRYTEEKFGKDLPVYRGDMGVFWEDGAASSAAETARVRWAKNLVATAEKWEALAGLRGLGPVTPGGSAEVWKNIIYYDEHTWGSAVSISDPTNPQSTGQWTRKAAFAQKALDGGRAAERDAGLAAFHKLAEVSSEENDRRITVSNPLSWERDVAVSLPADLEGNMVTDTETGASMPAQRAADGSLFFIAQKVPAMGWRIFEVPSAGNVPGASLLTPGADLYTWATARFQIHIHEKTGGVDRITDLNTGREWVDAASGYAMNQFLHVSGGNGSAMIHPGHPAATDLQVSTPDTATVTMVENGPARAILHIESRGGASPVDTDLVFYPDGTLDFVNVIRKVETLEKEGGYFVYPFGLDPSDQTKALLELPYGIIAADAEQLPGACREWYAVNTFAAVDNGAQSACVAAPDTPLFTVGDVNRGLWPAHVDGKRNLLFAYVYNNYWHTNYKASQGGDIRCAFSIRMSETPFDAVAATRFGWGRALDLTPEAQNAVRGGRLDGATARSCMSLDTGPVLLAELLSLDGRGRMLARLYNPSMAPAKTSFTVQGVEAVSVYSTDLFGENGTLLASENKINVPARSIATVVLQAE